MKAYIDIIRPKNLLIISITQWVLYICLILPFVPKPALDYQLFALLSLDTVILAAAGYVINDILDYRSDIKNKPSKTFISTHISEQSAIIYYVLLNLSGLFMALYVAHKINNIPLVTIYPVASIILFLYSYRFKNTVLTGNIIVSLFVCLVSGIVLYAEKNTISQLSNISNKVFIIEIFLAYIMFSFFLNLIREIVKDMEDMEGDKAIGLKTLIIVYGKELSKNIALFLTFFSFILILSWLFFTKISLHTVVILFIIIFIALPLVVVLNMIFKSKDKDDYAQISSILKWIMVAGIVSLILITSNL